MKRFINIALWFTVLSLLCVTAPLWLLFMGMGKALKILNNKVFPDLKHKQEKAEVKGSDLWEFINKYRNDN